MFTYTCNILEYMIHVEASSLIVCEGWTYVSLATTKGVVNVLSLARDDVQGRTPTYLCACTNGPIIPVVNDFGAQAAHDVLPNTFLLIVS